MNPDSPPYGTPRGDDDLGCTAPSPIALPPLDGSRRGGGFGFDFGGGGVETFDFAFDDLGGERDAEYSAAHPRTTRGTRGVRASVLSDDPPPFLLSGELVLPPLPPDPLPSEGPFPEAVDPPPPPPPPPPGPPGPPPPDAFELLSAPMSRCTSLS